MTTIKQIKFNDIDLDNLIHTIEDNLENELWWLPIDKIAKENFLNESWTIFLGAYDGKRLVGASALFLNEHEYSESASYLGLIGGNIAEIGRCMVLPDYRGRNILFEINKRLLEIANDLDINYVISTVHPDNISSNKSLMKIGMKYNCTIQKLNKYDRNVYLLKL